MAARLEAARQARLDAERGVAEQGERLRETVLDLGEAIAAVTAQLGATRAEVAALRAGLTLACAYAGTPAPADLANGEQPGEADGQPDRAYDAAAAIQARQRAMHLVQAGGDAR